MPRLVLFDVDATLLTTQGLGMECMGTALTELSGRPVDLSGTSFAGGLDPLIFRELAARHGLSPEEELHRRFRARYGLLLAERLEREPGRARLLPGVPALLDALEARVDVGLLTGNYPETAASKLRAAGLDPARFPVGAFGTDGGSRRDLPPVALARHLARSGAPLRAADLLVIGDTPLDVDCARANGCRSLGVATGRSSREELLSAGAEQAVHDLEHALLLLEWMTAD